MQALRLAGCTLLGALACSSVERSGAPTVGDCLSPDCRPALGGGSNSVRDAAASPANDAESDAAPRTRVSVQAAITVDTGFVDSEPFRGPVEVHAHGEDGRLTTSGDTPVQSPFALDVPLGTSWFALIDRAGVPQMAATLQPVLIDATTTSTLLRGLSRDALTNIFIDNLPWVPQVGAATLVLSFRRRGAVVGGVTVSPVAGASASTAYFESENRFTSDAPTSTFASTVMVRDIAPLPAYPTLTSLTVQYQVGSVIQLLAVRAARNFVTWVAVEVP